MNADIQCIHKELMELKREVSLIKNILISEGELTPWAKKELTVARKEKASSCVRLSAL